MLQAFGDVVIGSVLGPSSQRANECRIAMFLAGYPQTVPVRTVNRYAAMMVVSQSVGPLGPPLLNYTTLIWFHSFVSQLFLMTFSAGMHLLCMGMHSGNTSMDIALRRGYGHLPESLLPPDLEFQ